MELNKTEVINDLVEKSNNTQMSFNEYSLIYDTILESDPCNILVFGLGNDSVVWNSLNENGRTEFLEDNKKWMEICSPFNLSVHHVTYKTTCKTYKRYLKRPITVDIPKSLDDIVWDIIIVDAPRGGGATSSKPGRMSSIYTASVLKKEHTKVFVHDCNRMIEDLFTKQFLGNDYTQVDKLRFYK